MVNLNKRDWEQAREQAELMIRQAMVMKIVNENLLAIAEKELKKFPKDIPKGVA